jgi:hypothetical protein
MKRRDISMGIHRLSKRRANHHDEEDLYLNVWHCRTTRAMQRTSRRARRYAFDELEACDVSSKKLTGRLNNRGWLHLE